ncbi:MAG: hypothetical protein PWQ17_2583 [Anaerophaga sp.]|nr:hypothetical protein [Anaerophaga sp.]MDK2843076.1 hypothetical protein [Anaerophaga sp.]MDN5291489.1 hypothetical protein [Anaerophaga sp.]
MVEGARLESVYTPKAYRGFESLTLRKKAIPFKDGFLRLESELVRTKGWPGFELLCNHERDCDCGLVGANNPSLSAKGQNALEAEVINAALDHFKKRIASVMDYLSYEEEEVTARLLPGKL